MKTEERSFHLLTPCISSGADPRSAEIRVPSIRGELRWWFRVLSGDPAREKAVFGGVNGAGGARASSVRLRIVRSSGMVRTQNLYEYLGVEEKQAMLHPESYFLWPLRPTKTGTQSRGILHPSNDLALAGFDLHIVSSLSEELMQLWERTLDAFTYLGSLGTRARRGYGSLWPATERHVTVEDLQRKLSFLPAHVHVRLWERNHSMPREALCEAGRWMRDLRKGTERFSPPDPSSWGKNDHDAAIHGNRQTVFRPVLGLPLTQRFQGTNFETWHPDGSSRWASPLRIKIVRIENSFRVLTIFCDDRAMPENERLQLREKRGPSRIVLSSRELYDHMKREGVVIH